MNNAHFPLRIHKHQKPEGRYDIRSVSVIGTCKVYQNIGASLI